MGSEHTLRWHETIWPFSTSASTGFWTYSEMAWSDFAPQCQCQHWVLNILWDGMKRFGSTVPMLELGSEYSLKWHEAIRSLSINATCAGFDRHKCCEMRQCHANPASICTCVFTNLACWILYKVGNFNSVCQYLHVWPWRSHSNATQA